MNIHDVIDRATKDPVYAAELAAKAGKAARTKLHSMQDLAQGPWADVLAEFADGPEDLGRLTARFDEQDGSTWTTTSITSTTLTTTTWWCTTTTTTSVTTITTAGLETKAPSDPEIQ
jgi:hypothetical protein